MHFKQNNKEYRSYLQGLRPFRSTLPKGLKKMLEKKGYAYSEILMRWGTLVGDKISEKSFPKFLKTNRANKNGTLVLTIKRGDEIEIEYSKKQIIEKINSYFGYKLIDNIKLETFSSIGSKKIDQNRSHTKNYSEKFKGQIESIDNKTIKNALYKLINATK